MIVRDRQQASILKFEPGFRFCMSHARFDHIQVNLELGAIHPDQHENIHTAFRTIGADSKLLRYDGGNGRHRLIIRKEAGIQWLFSGEIKYYQGNLKACLHINPQRFFAHNPSNRRTDCIDDTGNAMPNSYKLTANSPEQCKIWRRTLDCNDNFVIDERLAEARAMDWPTFLAGYIELIRQRIVFEFLSRSPDDTFILNRKDWVIAGAEIAWEFKEDHALLAVEEFGKHASSHFYRHREVFHQDKMSHECDAKYHLFQGEKEGIEVALYAKARDRIRVECRYKDNPKILISSLNNARFPRENIDALPAFMRALTENAMKQIEPLKEAACSFSKQRVLNRVAAIGMLQGLAYFTQLNPGAMNRTMQSLSATQRVMEIYDDAEFNSFLKDLADRGLLKPMPKARNRPRTYCPSGPFKPLISATIPA